MSLSLQYLLIAAAVLLSAGFVLRSQCPRLLRSMRLRTAAWLVQSGHPQWMHRAGRALAPPVNGGAATRCGTGCGGCD